MGQDLPFACSCGKVHGHLHDITPKTGAQIQCHCADCRRAVIWLGQPDPADGVTYYQTSPDRVKFEGGLDQVQAFSWKGGKLVRWYAACCSTPMFNTLNTPKFAFASISVDSIKDPAPLGPVISHAFVTKPNGKTGHTNMGGFMWGFVKRAAGARITGRWRDTPFFDDAGAPIADVRALTSQDRATATLP